MMQPTPRTYSIAERIRRDAERLGVSPMFLAARVIEEMEGAAQPLRGRPAGLDEERSRLEVSD